MTKLTHAIRPPARPIAGGLWLTFMVAMWLAFFALAAANALDSVWNAVRDLPVVAELCVWFLAFPWMLGTAVWESAWPFGARAAAAAAFALAWTWISIPRVR